MACSAPFFVILGWPTDQLFDSCGWHVLLLFLSSSGGPQTSCLTVVDGMFCSFFCHPRVAHRPVHSPCHYTASSVRPALISLSRDLFLICCPSQFPRTFRCLSVFEGRTLARAPCRTRIFLHLLDLLSFRRHQPPPLPSKKKSLIPHGIGVQFLSNHGRLQSLIDMSWARAVGEMCWLSKPREESTSVHLHRLAQNTTSRSL